MSPLLDSTQTFVKGEIKPLKIGGYNPLDPSEDLSTATATIKVWNISGALTLTEGSATVSGSTYITISRDWDTTSVSPGSYRAEAKVTIGSNVFRPSWVVRVVASPAPIAP